MKSNFAILLTAVILTLLIPFAMFAQEEDLLKKLKLVPELGTFPAPDFVASTPEGETIGIDDLKGKLVLLNFWATWCPPCRLEMPSMEKLHQEFKGQGLEIVAVNFMEGLKPIGSFVKENGLSFTVLLDRTGEIAQSYRVRALPMTFLIGRKGNLLAKSIGYKNWHNTETREFVSSLLNDEAIINRGPKAEGRARFWQWDRRGLLLGIAVLGLLAVSTLWIKKAWFSEKQ
ncbi:MAG: TlpA disulfide reductase family protein [Candidatus Binatia bacterium]